MKANAKLIECLKCGNVYRCWDVYKPECDSDPSHMRPSALARLRLAITMIRTGSVRGFYIFAISCYVHTLLPKRSNDERADIIQTSLMITDALINTPYAGWKCPKNMHYIPKVKDTSDIGEAYLEEMGDAYERSLDPPEVY